MEIERWWPRLDVATQRWLIAHTGDVVPAAVLDRITRAGAPVTPEASWLGGERSGGVVLSDAAVDWIEEVANGEH